ncbi:glycosyltransferase family 39 protein [Acidobacteriota bacterium]
MSKNSRNSKSTLLFLLFFVLIVRVVFLGLFHDQVFLGPSTLFDQSYVAINILDGQGIKTFASPPQSVNPSETSQLIDPENYVLVSSLLVPYVKDVTGYALFLAFLWLLSGAKLWIFAQIVQILFDVVVALGLFYLAKKYFGKRAAYFSVFVFSILFFEARASVVPYKDIFNLYIMLAITLLGSLIFFQKRKKIICFLGICFLTGLGYYFMPSIVLYPFFLIVFLVILKRIPWKVGVTFLLLAGIVVGLLVFPNSTYVRSYKDNPQIAKPYFWYRFWLGTKIDAFYSTQEERFQEYFAEKIEATGLSIEAICKQEFFETSRKVCPQHRKKTILRNVSCLCQCG